MAGSSGDYCTVCGVSLTRDDIGLTKKLVNRGATSFLCKKCLAEHYKMSLSECDELIVHFKKTGCVLFN